jgi:hypothetical protein
VGVALAAMAMAAPAWADAQDDIVYAAREGHVALVTKLAQSADLNAADRSGQTPLIAAARAGQLEMVQVLLNQGASVTVRDWQGRNALDWAKANGHGGVSELLKPQQAFASSYLQVLGHAGRFPLWGGTLAVDYATNGTTHMRYTRPGLTLPTATMVARAIAGVGLDYGAPTLEAGWIEFPALRPDYPTRVRIKSWGYTAQEVEVWLK